MVGSTINPMVTVVAPTTPLAAASNTPTTITDSPRPPGSRPNNRPMVSRSSSAMRERSSITPMKTNSGMARSTSLVMMPKIRAGNAPSRPRSMRPAAAPVTAKHSDTPASVKATG
jgi:hypothetical protein